MIKQNVHHHEEAEEQGHHYQMNKHRTGDFSQGENQ
jgi:hypothetical protein